MTWKNFDMEQCHRFLYSWQDTEQIPCTDFLEMKSLDTTCFKGAWDNKLVSCQWYIHQIQSLLTYQMPTLFSNEHVISGSHSNNLETHLTLQKVKVTQVTQIVRVIRATFILDADYISRILFSNICYTNLLVHIQS